MRDCRVAAPRGDPRGEGAATHPGCPATRSRRQELGLDAAAAAHERCRFPARASPGAGGGAPRSGGVPTWVGGRRPRCASRLVAGPELSRAVGVGGRLGEETHRPGPDAICSARPPGEGPVCTERQRCHLYLSSLAVQPHPPGWGDALGRLGRTWGSMDQEPMLPCLQTLKVSEELRPLPG